MSAAAAPGLRETETLAPENLVGRAHAIVLSGGSVFGLAAADGVTSVLSGRDIGLHLKQDSLAIPIVPCAVLHDLGNGGDKRWGATPPYRHLGIRAVEGGRRPFRARLGRRRTRRDGGARSRAAWAPHPSIWAAASSSARSSR